MLTTKDIHLLAIQTLNTKNIELMNEITNQWINGGKQDLEKINLVIETHREIKQIQQKIENMK